MSSVEQVTKVSDLSPGEMKRVEVAGKVVLLANADGDLLALAGECTHAGGPLDEGFLEHGEIECPWHQGRFNVRSGEVTGPPPLEPLPRYKVWVRGEDVIVDVGQAPEA